MNEIHLLRLQLEDIAIALGRYPDRSCMPIYIESLYEISGKLKKLEDEQAENKGPPNFPSVEREYLPQAASGKRSSATHPE